MVIWTVTYAKFFNDFYGEGIITSLYRLKHAAMGCYGNMFVSGLQVLALPNAIPKTEHGRK